MRGFLTSPAISNFNVLIFLTFTNKILQKLVRKLPALISHSKSSRPKISAIPKIEFYSFSNNPPNCFPKIKIIGRNYYENSWDIQAPPLAKPELINFLLCMQSFSKIKRKFSHINFLLSLSFFKTHENL